MFELISPYVLDHLSKLYEVCPYSIYLDTKTTRYAQQLFMS